MDDKKSLRSKSAATPDAANPTTTGVGTGDGYSGQEYDANDHASERWLRDLDRPDPNAKTDVSNVDRRDMGPETGARATVDPKTGAVKGSGSGAGGGNPGEDYDSDTGGDEQLNEASTAQS